MSTVWLHAIRPLASVRTHRTREDLIVELALPFEGAIGHPAPQAQQRDRLIHHCDKIHPVSSLPEALSTYAYVSPP